MIQEADMPHHMVYMKTIYVVSTKMHIDHGTVRASGKLSCFTDGHKSSELRVAEKSTSLGKGPATTVCPVSNTMKKSSYNFKKKLCLNVILHHQKLGFESKKAYLDSKYNSCGRAK